MDEIIVRAANDEGIMDEALFAALEKSIETRRPSLKKVLLLPPDMTRMQSGAGRITAKYYELLKDSCQVDILPALGTHEPMSEVECIEFFGEGVPFERIFAHDWRSDVEWIGTIPGDFVEEVSEGLVKAPIDVEVNRRLLDRSYDLVISIGQVVPHEVVGMANYSKNIFVGCGGRSMIGQSHIIGAFYGMERMMGRDCTPVRRILDYAEEHFLEGIPLMYVLTVTTHSKGRLHLHGLFIGRKRVVFEEAVRQSQEKNLTFLKEPLQKVVVFLDEKEFKSTWLGNKSIYRTRMAIADGGELVILAPGVRKFGEDGRNDEIIRKYGYIGKKNVISLCEENEDLQNNLSVTAHLIHGSSDGRFSITYAVDRMTKEEIEGANFKFMPLSDALHKYDPDKLADGFNILEDGETIFFIRNPAIGLWACKDRFYNTASGGAQK